MLLCCSALAFNEAGDQLATVGSQPDYLLTLWRWEDEAIVLRSKVTQAQRAQHALRPGYPFEPSLLLLCDCG